MKFLKIIVTIILIPMFLTGCLYPDEKIAENQIPYKDQIQAVQTAVDQFQSDEDGILPINTKEAETPIYQKYVINFKKIAPKYIAEIPGNAYESGGVFQYVLVDVENNPTVKLLDVRMAQEIQDVVLRLTAYKQKNGYAPFGDQLSDFVYTLKYEEMGLKEAPTVTSPYSQKKLPIVINTEGDIYVDYTTDLYDALQQTDHPIDHGEDIRDLLVRDTDFVPAYSLPYTVDSDGKIPIFLTK